MNLNSKRQDFFVTRKLREDGVTFHGLRYTSPALQKLHNQLRPLAEVTLRYDPSDLTRVYVRDRGREEWIEVFLAESHAPRSYDFRMIPRRSKP
jgi:hypothetical protein